MVATWAPEDGAAFSQARSTRAEVVVVALAIGDGDGDGEGLRARVATSGSDEMRRQHHQLAKPFCNIFHVH